MSCAALFGLGLIEFTTPPHWLLSWHGPAYLSLMRVRTLRCNRGPVAATAAEADMRFVLLWSLPYFRGSEVPSLVNYRAASR
jgi:hypothetical protein